MNPLTLLPLLAAAVMAAPGAHVVYQQPALGYAQVPLTQTVHYAAQPVVTGYSTTVVKPALAAPVSPIAVQGTPYLTYQYARQIPPIGDLPQIPGQGGMNGTGDMGGGGLPVQPTPPSDLPMIPGQGGGNNGTGDQGGLPVQPTPPSDLPVNPPAAPGAPGGGNNGTGNDQGGLPVQPTPPSDLPVNPPAAPGAPGGGDNNNGTGNDQGGSPVPGVPVPGVPGGVALLSAYNPGHFQLTPLSYAQNLAVQPADAVVLQARSLPVAAVRAAQAGDFEPLVTKEKVLAPVRTHTQITPQYTQFQPEISVRKIVHEVPVATPVAVNQPVFQQFVA